jgi:hypothetical protein
MRIRLCVLVLLLTALSTTFAAADEIRFIYDGRGSEGTATGFGSFTFPHGLTAVSLSDVTSFFFNQAYVFDNSKETFYFFYGTNDLTNFSAMLTGSALTSLSLDTAATAAWPLFLAPQSFHVTALGIVPFVSAYTTVGTSFDIVTEGRVTVVPEPGTLGLIGTGCIFISALVRKRLRI